MNGPASVGRVLSSNSCRAALLAASATAVLSLALTVPSHVLRPAESPPSTVDGRDYDHLALNLARGRGFAYCWSDPEWRAPYERAASRKSYSMHLSLGGPCFPTARRAPGHPFALAAVYRLWGRSFEAARLLGAVALALAGAGGAFLAVRAAGLGASALFTSCFLLDGQLRSLVGAYMSEPLTSLAVVGVVAAHAALFRRPRPWAGVLAGSTLGLLLLVRHHFSLLFTIAVVAATLVAVRRQAARAVCVAYCATALLVFGPWGVRNCLVLGAPMPLGTQGGHVLAGKFGAEDAAGTRWDAAMAARLWATRQHKPPGYTAGTLVRELRSSLAADRELARAGNEAARSWLLRNWRRLPAVALPSLRAHARGHGALGLLALLWGLPLLARPDTRPVAIPAFAIVAATALTVALTYEAGGRFAAPVRPTAYLVGSLGVSVTAAAFRQRRLRQRGGELEAAGASGDTRG